jgi:hypothetical protein
MHDHNYVGMMLVRGWDEMLQQIKHGIGEKNEEIMYDPDQNGKDFLFQTILSTFHR